MRPTTHSISLTLLGFITGAVVVFALDHLPPIAAETDAAPRPARALAPPQGWSSQGFADAVASAAPAVVKVFGVELRPAARNQRPVAPQLGNAGVLSSTAQGSMAQPLPLGIKGRGHHRTSLGSGVIITQQGLIVTNGHVVRDLGPIQVELANGDTLAAELVGIDEAIDLAVLQVRADDLPTIALGDPSKLRSGDVVLTIGNPYGIGQTVSLGIVSGTGRSRLGLTEVEDFIQTDAAINPGSSGGALVDIQGRLVGIATAALSQSGHSEGVGFAIPATLVMQVVEALADSNGAKRGWLGLGGRSVTSDLEQRFGLRASTGVLVSTVVEDGPAAAAGLRAGDVITEFAGTKVDDAFQLRTLISATAPNREVALVLWRGSERFEVMVRTAEWTADAAVSGSSARRQQVGAQGTERERHAGTAEQDWPYRTQPCSASGVDC